MKPRRPTEVAMSERDEASSHPAERTVHAEQGARQAHPTEWTAISERHAIAGKLQPCSRTELCACQRTHSEIESASAKAHRLLNAAIRMSKKITNRMMSITPSTVPAVASPSPPSVGSDLIA